MISFHHILVPTDFGDASNEALEVAASLAAKFDARLTVLHANWLLPAAYRYAEGVSLPTDELTIAAERALNEFLAKAKRLCPKAEGTFAFGEPWRQILGAARDRGADLIVMGTHGRRGLPRLFMGSVAEKIVRLSPVPVLTVSTKAEQEAKRAVAADEADAQTP
jgi:nucleotide-binding universal stress UspA family protein